MYRLSLSFWSQQGRSAYGGYGVSALMHVAGMALLAAIWPAPSRSGAVSATVDSRWTVQEPLVPVTILDAASAHATPSEGKAGGRSLGAVLPEQRAAGRGALVKISILGDAAPLDVASVVPAGANWGEGVRLAQGGAGGLGGVGSGDGTGDGDGNGGGFFGINPPVSTVVFVVDNSGSMNHPHDSFAKTRFRRLKFELAKCISAMHEDTQFFIVFFNEEPLSMPANSMVFATPTQKQKYIQWMATVKAIGETDPRGALAIALKLRPQTIYFLTDGSFAKKIERELLKMPRAQSVIHTFAFGEEAGKDVMKQFAERNGGQFHFVP